MEVNLSRNDILNAAAKVIPAINPRTTLPVLSNILFETIGKDSVKITATDLEIGITTTLPANVSDEGKVTIPAKKFVDIIRELPEENVEINITKNNSVSIKSGKSYFKLMGLAHDDFPKFPKSDGKKGVEIEGTVLKEAIKLTSFAISDDETRYVLNGALVEYSGSNLKVVATDGRRLAIYEGKTNTKSEDDISVIIPAKALHELNRNIEENGNVKMLDLGNQVMFLIDETVIVSRLIEGHFPNYRQVIPSDNPIRVKFSTKDLLLAVKRVSILTSTESQAIKMDILKGNKVIISSRSPNLGESKEEIDVEERMGKEITIGFNPVYLLDVLKNLDVEYITFMFSSSNKPGVISGKEGYTYVIMPMQV